MPVFSPIGLQQGVARQTQGVRQLLMAELQRRQQMQQQLELARQKQLMAQQDPMQRLLQQGQAAQAIQNISALGGDVSQFQGLFGGGAGIPTPTPTPIPAPAPVTPTTPVGRPTITGVPEGFRAKGLEQTVLGGLRPTGFERIPERKGLAGESAAKLTMINQALSDLEGVEKQLFTPEGKFKRGLAFAANIPGGQAFGIGRVIPDVGFGTEARILNSRMNNALEAKLRIETGAAATQEEFNRLQTRFGVTGFDTPESARNKIRRLKEFMRNAIITIDPTGKFTYKSQDTKLDRELNVDIPQLQSLGLDPNRYEIIGEE